MEGFFGDCVDGVIELLDDQIEQIKKIKHRAARVSRDNDRIVQTSLLTILQNVFLVGGFGASPYLQEQLRELLEDLRVTTLRRPAVSKS